MLNRDAMLAAVAEPTKWDVIIIGGGATGLGCAVDAAARGYRTLLLEARDFAQGTSSRSTKLIHGGVRYLRSGQIGMVRDALREREHLLRNAASIVQPLPMAIPSFTRGARWYYLAGLKTYDWLAGTTQCPGAKLLSPRQCASLLPNLNTRGLRGGVSFTDGQFDDARLAIALASAAAQRGGILLNYMPVVRLCSRGGRIVGVVARDAEQGREYELEGAAIINATGVFAEQIWDMESAVVATPKTPRPKIVPSQGIHLVLPSRFLPGKHALLIPETPDGRVLFVIPWQGQVLLGTTDKVVSKIDVEPLPTGEEIDYLLQQAGEWLSLKPTRADVQSVFAGLRPLVGQGEKRSANLSREHEISVSDAGMIHVIGGKWTTYRLMAEQLVDLAARLGNLPRRPTTTQHIPLADDRPAGQGGPTIHPDLPITATMLQWAIEREMSRTIEDVLARRTRGLFLNAAASVELASQVAVALAATLGRDSVWQQAQLVAFKKLAENYQMPGGQGILGQGILEP